jgi:hypothetical protein
MAIVLDGTSGITTPALDSVARFATADMPLGSVLQVVNVSYSTQVAIASTSYQDTGLTASITPTSASSKILVLVTHTVRATQLTSNARLFSINLLRGATQIAEKKTFSWGATGEFSATANSIDGSIICLDSPATASSVTYKTQGNVDVTANSTALTFQNENTTSTITLMEIAA